MTSSTNTLRIGIVGAGLIAGVIANAVKQSTSAQLVAVASRRHASAQDFADEHGIQQVFASVDEMLASSDIDAVYIATPTLVKESIAVAATQKQKHVLVDKPFIDVASVQRIADSAVANDVAFMDATHFVHNQRSTQLIEQMQQTIGTPQALRSTFFFPLMDRENIRFDTEKEPTGAVGDMLWYCIRAIIEYLQPTSQLKSIGGAIVRDQQTDAVIRGTGYVAYEDGKSSSFDFGYDAEVCLMDLDILGTDGMVRMDDFVLDWKQGFAFDNSEHVVGYTKRSAMQEPKDFEFITAPAEQAQAVTMIEHFARLTTSQKQADIKNSIDKAVQTQTLLDAYWQAVK